MNMLKLNSKYAVKINGRKYTYYEKVGKEYQRTHYFFNDYTDTPWTTKQLLGQLENLKLDDKPKGEE